MSARREYGASLSGDVIEGTKALDSFLQASKEFTDYIAAYAIKEK